MSEQRGSNFLAFHHRNVDEIDMPVLVCIAKFKGKAVFEKGSQKWPVIPTLFSVSLLSLGIISYVRSSFPNVIGLIWEGGS